MTEFENLADGHDPEAKPPASRDEIQYRSFNPWSLVALLFGLLSLLTIASMGWLVMAALGVVAGSYAMAGCAKRRLIGYGVAWLAVFLSIAGATLGVGYYFGRIGWLATIARWHGETVIAAIQADRLEEAFTYALEPGIRPERGTDLFEYYKSNEKPRDQPMSPVVSLNLWMQLHPVMPMVDDLLNGQFNYVGYQSHQVFPDREEVILRYRYTPKFTDIEPFVFDINYHRRRYPDPIGGQWRARLFGVADEDADQTPVRNSTTAPTTPRKRIKPQPGDEASSPAGDP